jgi:hypothetical protein
MIQSTNSVCVSAHLWTAIWCSKVCCAVPKASRFRTLKTPTTDSISPVQYSLTYDCSGNVTVCLSCRRRTERAKRAQERLKSTTCRQKTRMFYLEYRSTSTTFLVSVLHLFLSASQLEGAKPLQFVSWRNIFMKKTALRLPAAVPAISTRLQPQDISVHMTTTENSGCAKACSISYFMHSDTA